MTERKRIAILEVPLEEYGERELFLKYALATATYGKTEVDITYSGVGLHFYVDKKYYLIKFNKITEAVCETLEELGKIKIRREKYAKK